MLVDSHTHLNHPKFAFDWKEALRRAKSAGVSTVINVGYDLQSSELAISQCTEVVEDGSKMFASVAVHPHEAKNWDEKAAEKLRLLAMHPSVIAIGEIGLDFHYDFSPRGSQIKAFEEQLEIARQLNLPVILHIREAHAEALRLVRNFGKPIKGVAHCFTGTWEEAKGWLDLGFYIGITGIITFGRKVSEIVEVAVKTPLERLLLETDAPYLAPVPYRGKRNEPAFLPLVAQFVSKLRNDSKVAEETSQNAFSLFRLGTKLLKP